MRKFYDKVIEQAQIWIPRMKAADFETIVKNKFEERIKSKDYIEGNAIAEEFKTYLDKYISKKQASTDPKQLLDFNMPVFDLKKSYLDFNLVHFEDFLRTEKYNFGDRNDLKKAFKIRRREEN